MKLSDKLTWNLMVYFIKTWTNNHMDQWDKFTYDSKYGRVYVTISYKTEHPDSFEEI